ncbi:MAG: sel1 repeat family protein [Immundisolibacteraceae bacterium]|nr:sel1 repeat family protein [Immundisolibacteraceae bacterium]
MKNRFIFIGLGILLGSPLQADTFDDAVSAYNSGHYSAAKQLVNQMSVDDTRAPELRDAIDIAIIKARQNKEYALSVADMEQQGEVIRTLDDPEMMRQLFEELDRSSDRFVSEQIKAQSLAGSNIANGELTVEQELARLQAKMNGQSDNSMAGSSDQLGNGTQQEQVPAVSLQSQCMSNSQIKKYFSQARSEAAAFAMDKARAIAKANEIRQQRAVARVRLEIAEQLTLSIRQDLDGRFKNEVAARVEAVLAGKMVTEAKQLADNDIAIGVSPGMPALPGHAEYLLAQLYAAGHGVFKQTDSGLGWLHLAAEKGFVQAQYELGTYYFQGSEFRQADYVAATRWWELARDNHHADAPAALAMIKLRVASGPLAAAMP